MNRRTFIKLTGITTIATITIPTIAKTETKWIPFTERLPKVGQKVIVTLGSNLYYNNISGGTIQRSSKKAKRITRQDFSTFYMVKDFSKDDYKKGLRKSISIFYSKEGQEALKSKEWLKPIGEMTVTDFSRIIQRDTHTCYRTTSFLWLPVNGEYPDTIPPIPARE